MSCRRKSVWLHVLLAGLLAGAAACGSVRTDRAAASEGRTQGLEEQCGETSGFTARAVLDRVDREYTAPLYYPKRRARTTLRLRPEYRAGTIECLPAGPDAPDRSAKMTVEVSLEVRTDDGGFDESIPGTLSGYADSEDFRISGAREVGALVGSYGDRDDVPAGAEVLVEGWLGVDGGRSEGAIRLVGLDSSGRDFDPTVGIWDRGEYLVTRPHRPCGGEPGLTRRAFAERLEGGRTGRIDFSGRAASGDVELRLSRVRSPVVCGRSPTGVRRLTTEVRIELRDEVGRFDESIRGRAHLTAGGELYFRGVEALERLDGSFELREEVPAGSELVVRGSVLRTGDRAKGSLALRTESGNNPLGVPNLASWRVRRSERVGDVN